MRLHSGEVEATGWRIEKLTDLAQRLRDASPGIAGRPRLIAIDGRGGSGKTTLAQRLRVTVPRSWTVHTDDVAWNHAFFDWTDVIIENALRPLYRGEAVQFRPRAWVEHGRPGTIDVPAGLDVVWVEGTGIVRRHHPPRRRAEHRDRRGVAPSALRLADHGGDRPLQNVQYPCGACCRSRGPSSRSKTTTARTTPPAMAAASNAGNTMPTTATTAAIRATTVIANTVLRRGDSRSLLSESGPGAGTAVADAIVVSGR
jgi:hypothetical protein